MRSPLVVFLFGLVVMLSACGRTVTPAELEHYESHSFAGDKKQVYRATVTALRSLGYEVVASDEGAGRVKTAPKVVVVQAAQTSSYTAVAASASIAWTINVTSDARGAVVHAEPRIYSAGTAVDASNMSSDYADRTFHTLYDEIQSNLPGTTTPTSARVTK